jgi:ferredoxin-NADP reductase
MKISNQWVPATVTALRDLTPTVREIELTPADGPAQVHAPGAHVQVQVLVGQGASAQVQTRSYSLIGEPDGRAYRIAVKRLNEGRGGSLAMWRLAVGERLRLSEPQNFFPLDASAPGYLVIAGGIGITPLVLMAQRLQAITAQTGVPLRMLYGARSADELAYLPLLRETLGDVLAVFIGSSAMNFDTEIAAMPPGAQLYTCGPAPMLEAIQRAWHAAGRPLADLRFETFGSSGRYPTQSFQLKLPRHGLDVTVPAHSSVLDVLEAAGLPCLSNCRRGECGLCAMDIVAVDGELDHRDIFLSTHEKQAQERICVCVSRAVGCLTLDSAYRPD